MSTPLISVIMSAHNASMTLPAALASIEQQTFQNWELVVCDDASTDSTQSILTDAVGEFGANRLILLRNEVNRKLAYSLNRCLEVASGDFIARMDADDLSEPTRFEVQLRYLAEHPEVDVVGTAMRRFNANGPGEVVYPAAEEPDKWTLGRSTKSPFFHATILARREVFEKVGNYTVSWRTERGQDLDLWFKFFAAGLVGCNLRDPLYWVREDAAAIRRRTPKARFGAYVTRLKGNWALRYPLGAYVRCTVDVLKILVPYWVFDWHRERSRKLAAAPERRGVQTR